MKISFQSGLKDYFQKHLIHERGASENTIKTYRDTFVQLLEFFKDEKKIDPNKIKIDDINRDNILLFLDWLEINKKVSIATRNNRLAAIKSFIKYIQNYLPEYLDTAVQVLAIRSKKAEIKTINYLTIEATKHLFASFDQNDKHDLRDLCIILLLYDSGARVSELINIRNLEVSKFKPYTVVLHGKGNKTRIVPIDETVWAQLNRYIKLYKVKPDEYLFTNSRKEKLTREGVSYVLKTHFEKAKDLNRSLYPKNISPHCLRHSKAMHLLENGVNIIYIRDFLGHVSVTTTEIYSKASPELKKKYIELHNNQITSVEYDEEQEAELLKWLKDNL